MTKTPLMVGVTGHRDLILESEKLVSGQVREFLANLQSSLPNTPLMLMTGLADGADRLVARVALELGILVQAVLPMPMAMYEKDFSRESREDFKSLISQEDIELIELPLPQDVDADLVAEYGPERDKLYAQLGEYLIERSGILIALWDGSNSDLLGGTSDVVLRYLNAGGAGSSVQKEILFLDKTETNAGGPEFVYWVPVTRASVELEVAPLPEQGIFLSGNLGCNTLYKQTSMPKELQLQMQHLEDYNQQYEEIVAGGKFFTWGGMLENLPDNEAHPEYPVLKAIDDEYQKADGLALYNQKFSDQQFKLFAYMAALMGLLFLLYAKIIAAKVFLIGYLALFIAGLVMVRKTEHKHWFTRHLMQRVIAETLRTRFYLVLAGIDRRVNVDKMLDLTGVKQFSGFSWINQIFHSHQSIDGTVKSREVQQADIEYACDAWLDDQAGYFKSKVEKLSHHHHRLEKIKTRLLIASAVSVVLLILFKKYLAGAVLVGHLDMKTLLVFFMGLLPFWLGVWEIYQSKMAIKELLWQYRNQDKMFSLARVQIKHSNTIEEKRTILANLGEKSLMENYLWTIHRYHREHEPPTAG